MEKFQDTDLPKNLMCHMYAGLLDDWNVDYVFVGHVHGGEVILSFIGDFDTNEVIICFKTGDKLANMSTIKQKILDFRWRVEA